MGAKDDNLGLSTPERAKAMALGRQSAEAIKGADKAAEERGASTGITAEQALSQLENWPAAPKNLGTTLVEHYGPPHEMTSTKMFWYRVGPWAQMELTADEVVHNFPTPHTDFFAQFVEYPVDPAKVAEVAAFDGSVIINRTAGQIGSRCDTEAANTLTLNVLVDLLEGRKTLDEARDFLAENLAAFGMGRDAPYAEKLQFAPVPSSPDPDESNMQQAALDQIKEKAKDIIGKGEPAS